jgi:tRNA A-37 threonylcarbamoyl transferase component Bud32
MATGANEPSDDPGMTAKLEGSWGSTSPGVPVPPAATVVNSSDAAKPAAPPHMAGVPKIPDVELDKLLGRGGMGAVYKGRQISLNRPVAVKVIKPELATDETFVKRFEREARSLATLSHPNIISCYQRGKAETGESYLLMEFVEGRDLRDQVLKGTPLSERDALVIVRQVADALGHALDAGIIHRDVKPENILLKTVAAKNAATSIGVQAKLVDLGLAALAQPDADAVRITATGTALGTPVTMAPEQAESPDSIDHRADIYALGCTLYFALTRKFPHEGGTVGQVIAKKIRDETPSPKRYREDLSESVCALLKKMIAYQKDERPATYDHLLALLDAEIATKPVPPNVGSGTQRFAPGSGPSPAVAHAAPSSVLAPDAGEKRSGIGVVLFAAIGLVVLLGGGVFLFAPKSDGHHVATDPSPPEVASPEPVAVKASPSPAAAPAKEPPLIAWDTTKHLFDGAESPLERWVKEPPVNSWSEAETTGAVDASLERHSSVALFLADAEIPSGDWKLTGIVSPKTAPYMGVRVVLEDLKLDFTIQPLNPIEKPDDSTTVVCTLARSDAGHEHDKPLALGTLAACKRSSHEFTVVFSQARFWARIPDLAWLSCDVPPGRVKRLGLFARKNENDARRAVASFGSVELALPR